MWEFPDGACREAINIVTLSRCQGVCGSVAFEAAGCKNLTPPRYGPIAPDLAISFKCFSYPFPRPLSFSPPPLPFASLLPTQTCP